MKVLTVALAVALAACSTQRAGSMQSTAQPGHGAITIQVVPNPIAAHKVSGDVYEFPFDVVLRETGGHPLTISRVSADVFALGGIRVANESYDAARITSLGYTTTVPANAELRYHFAPQKSVTNDALFNNVSAQIRVDAVDDTNTPASATVTVTVTR